MTDLNKLRETIEDWPNMFSDGKTNFIPVRDVLDLIDDAVEQIRAEIDEQTEIHSDGEFYIKNIEVKRIIDKYTGRKESE